MMIIEKIYILINNDMGENFNNLLLDRNVLWKVIITIIVTDTTFFYGLIQKR